VRDYLLHLINEKHASHSTITHAYSALKFIYEVTLKRPGEVTRNTLSPKLPGTPRVLDRTEIDALFT